MSFIDLRFEITTPNKIKHFNYILKRLASAPKPKLRFENLKQNESIVRKIREDLFQDCHNHQNSDKITLLRDTSSALYNRLKGEILSRTKVSVKEFTPLFRQALNISSLKSSYRNLVCRTVFFKAILPLVNLVATLNTLHIKITVTRSSYQHRLTIVVNFRSLTLFAATPRVEPRAFAFESSYKAPARPPLRHGLLAQVLTSENTKHPKVYHS